MLTDFILSDSFFDLSLILALTLVGSFSKISVKTFQNPGGKTTFMDRLLEIFLSTVTATVIVFTFADRIKAQFAVKGLVLASYATGLVGYEILIRISSLKGLMSFLSSILEFYRYVDNTHAGGAPDPDIGKYNNPPPNQENQNQGDDDDPAKEEIKYRWKTEEEIERENELKKLKEEQLEKFLEDKDVQELIKEKWLFKK